MKKYISVFLALSLVINVVLGVTLCMKIGLFTPGAGEENLSWIASAGTYGPEGIKTVEGDVTINSPGVILQNTLVTGHLYINGDLDNGSLELLNVTVEGSTVINVTGSGKIILQDALMDKLVNNSPDGQVQIIASGATGIGYTTLETATSLLDNNLLDDAVGFDNVIIRTSEPVELCGIFGSINVEAEKARVLFTSGKAIKLLVSETAGEASIDFLEETGAEETEILAAAEITGAGTFETTVIRVAGLTRVAGDFEHVSLLGKGIFVELTSGRIENLVVKDSEGTVSVHLAKGTTVSRMELNGKTGVTGNGTVTHAVISHEGCTIDQTPEQVSLASGVTAMVGGKELPEKIGGTAPPPAVTPRVTLSAISGVSNLYTGNSATRNVTVSPGDAGINASSNNTAVATVSVSGKTLTVTGKNPGTARITVTGSKSGFNSGSLSFNVTVVGPTSIRSFKTFPGLAVGKTFVEVEIYANDPQNYLVTVAGTTLLYDSAEKYFFGDVNSDDAQKSNVKVTKK